MHKPRLFLLDAYALIFRAYYGLGNNFLYNSKKQNVTAISGFTQALWQILEKENPDYIGVAFDEGAPVERLEVYSEYKANRQETPEDIIWSVPYIKQIIEAFNIPILAMPGYEADDVIGTLSVQAEKQGVEVYMVTPDKDFGQLITEHVKMYRPGRKGGDVEIIGVAETLEDWGIDNVKQVIDILGLWGDAVDNIPGVPGIGEKTASKLIKEYGSIENLLANTDKLKGKQKENLETYAKQALMSKLLATIDIQVPIELNLGNLKRELFNREKLQAIFSDLEFRTLAKRILGDSPNYEQNETKTTPVKKATPQMDLFGNNEIIAEPEPTNLKTIENVTHEYTLADTANKLGDLIDILNQADEYCFDTETTGLDTLTAELVGLSFSIKPHTAWYVPLPNDKIETLKILELFRPIFLDEQKTLIGQNIKFDMRMLIQYGFEIKNKLYDTMLAHYVLSPEGKHGMDYLSETLLQYKPISIETLIGKKGVRQGNMRDVELNKIAEYAAEDADITLQLKHQIDSQLDDALRYVFTKIDTPLIKVLSYVEQEGVRIDTNFLKDYSNELANDLLGLEKEIYNLADATFNIDSPRQLGEILFERMKLPYNAQRTKTKQYSTGEEVLETLENTHPIAGKILAYREFRKLKSTYVDALPEMVNSSTSRVHTTFNQTIAATGRLSSINPNLQNIPIKTEKGRRIRKAFVPRNEEYKILSADYSQIELRLVAEVSQDKNMLDAFEQNADIHAATAAKVYGIDINEVTKEMRGHAKMVNFGIIYGISAFGLSQRLGIPRAEAKDLIDGYFREFAGVKKYMTEAIAFAQKHGYVQTLLGRRRYTPDINSRNFTVRGFAERMAINSPIQGTAADLIKLAMIHIFEKMQAKKMRSKMILQVHDELVFDAHESEIYELQNLVIHEMKNAMPTLKVPLLVECGLGNNWLEAH